jgi:hypothetical protein
LLGENGKGERVFFLHIPMPTKLGTFQWPLSLGHSNGHQAWNILMAIKLGTFQWPPSMEPSIGHQALDPPSPPFSFSLKGELRSLGALSCLEDNFHAILNTCFYEFLEEAKKD